MKIHGKAPKNLGVGHFPLNYRLVAPAGGIDS
jgi:hypothetical protein